MLASGGLLALLGLSGASVASANPTGQIGTSASPLNKLYADTLEGPLVGGNTVESLVGNGIGVSGNSLYTTQVQDTEPSVGPQGTFWLQPSTLEFVNDYDDGGDIFAISYGSDGSDDFVYAGGSSNKVNKINPPDMSAADSYNDGNTIYAIEYGADGSVYYGGANSSVVKLDPTSLTVSDSYNEGSTINAISYGGDGFVYAGGESNRVVKLDPSNLSGASQPEDSYNDGNAIDAISYGGGFVYAGGGNDQVVKVDPSNMSAVDSYFSTGGILSISYGADGFVYAGGGSNQVVKIDPSNMSSVDSYSVGSLVTAVEYGADGFVYVAAGNNQEVLKLDSSSLSDGPVGSYRGYTYFSTVSYGGENVYAGGGKVNKLSTGGKLSVSTGGRWVQVI